MSSPGYRPYLHAPAILLDGRLPERVPAFPLPDLPDRAGTKHTGPTRCTGNYWRMEAGMNQTVRLGLSERLSYNLSGGLFFNQHNMYFADFSYFAKRYFPELGATGLAGSFIIWVGIGAMPPTNIFKGTSCTRAHSFYCDSSSPIPRRHKYLVSERFYLSQLWTPVLPNYSELGYGIG